MSGTSAAPGRFVTFEGGEGVGKSTAMRLAAEWLAGAGIEFVSTREPGGTPTAEAIRSLLLHHDDEPLSDTAELLLMYAARAQSVTHVIRPALARGVWVLCDRFTDSTLAYQGYGRGQPLERIRALAEWVHGGLVPDLTVLLDAPADVVAARMAGRGAGPDRIERERRAFFDRVRNGYDSLAKAEPARFRIVDTNCSRPALRDRLGALLEPLVVSPKTE